MDKQWINNGNSWSWFPAELVILCVTRDVLPSAISAEGSGDQFSSSGWEDSGSRPAATESNRLGPRKQIRTKKPGRSETVTFGRPEIVVPAEAEFGYAL